MGSGDRRTGVPQHILETVPGLPPESVATLRKQWIETAEQVLAICSTAKGRAGLQHLLGLDEEGLAAFLSNLRGAVGEEVASRLSRPSAGGASGAVLTDEQKRRFGMD
jgi:hypothetical protein